ncbi:MAG: mechanosensitive ion channel [Gammaproteobacteria bacterium]|nr:MAG: mechanosensitive ion channel [Gammaproteobacteria bacterium]
MIAGLLILLVTAIFAAFITKRLWLRLIRLLVTRTHTTWDDALVQQNVFGKLSQIVPALLISKGILFVPDVSEGMDAVIQNVANAWIVLIIIMAASSTLAAIKTIYETTPGARERPIKGFIQLGQVAVWVVGAILIVSVLIDQSPAIMLGGLGALTAVSMLVFQDTLLSLVASIQLTSQQIIRVGDWLEMPDYGADGDVIDVALYNVTIQNWDKTITTIPTNKLVSGAFKNWRGMAESGGRRIKRSINLDLNSVRSLTDVEVKKYSDFALLKDYIASKQKDLQAYNTALDAPGEGGVNLRRLTNIGTFRAYLYNYLKNHPKINTDMTLIVRQLQSGSEGVPVEVYCFSNDTNWFNYEGIQSDIFDHLFAMVPEFGLKIYQSPAGADIQRLTGA